LTFKQNENIDLQTAVQDVYGTLENYLLEMSKDHAYGDGIILAMVPFVFHRNVVIYYCDRTISLCEPSEREPIRLGYVNKNHYVSVLRFDTNAVDQNEKVSSALATVKLFKQTENTEINQSDNLEVNQEKISKEQTGKVPLQKMAKTCSTRNSTVTLHPWISCQNDGYYCKICRDSEFHPRFIYTTMSNYD
jgi:hypothetical protein